MCIYRYCIYCTYMKSMVTYYVVVKNYIDMYVQSKRIYNSLNNTSLFYFKVQQPVQRFHS